MIDEYFFNGDYEDLLEKLIDNSSTTRISNFNIEVVKQKVNKYLDYNNDIDLVRLVSSNELKIDETSESNINTIVAALFGGFIGLYAVLLNLISEKQVLDVYWWLNIIVYFLLLGFLYRFIRRAPKKERIRHKKFIIIKIAIEEIINEKK